MCSAIRAPKRYRISPRLGAGVRRQSRPAVSAALTARATSAALPAWNVPMMSRVLAGLRLSNVRPDSESTHSPAMNRRNVGGSAGRAIGLSVGGARHATRSNAIATEPPPPRHSVARP